MCHYCTTRFPLACRSPSCAVIMAINHFFFVGDPFLCLFSPGQRGSQRNPGTTRASWLDSKKNHENVKHHEYAVPAGCCDYFRQQYKTISRPLGL